jgi:hypothetical protein
MIGLVLAAASVLGTVAVAHKYKQKTMSTEAKCIFDTVLAVKNDPNEILQYAEKFAQSGYKAEAEILKKRAALMTRSPEEQMAVRDAFKKGMASTDPDAIDKLADLFYKAGRVGAAYDLRSKAEALRALSKVPNQTPVVLPPIPDPTQNVSPTANVPSPIEPNHPTDVAPVPGGHATADPAPPAVPPTATVST